MTLLIQLLAVSYSCKGAHVNTCEEVEAQSWSVDVATLLRNGQVCFGSPLVHERCGRTAQAQPSRVKLLILLFISCCTRALHKLNIPIYQPAHTLRLGL